MYIDIGADNKAEAESFGIRPGLQVVPICEFTPLANPKIMAKAWDNRYGVGLAIELVQALHGEKRLTPFTPAQPSKKSSDCAEHGLQPI